MKKNIYITIAILILLKYANGQGVRNMWLAGYNTLTDQYTTAPTATVDFNSGIANVIPTTRKMKFLRTAGNIADANGNLLMSSNGIWIANATGDTMLNGSDLNPGAYTNSWKPYGLPNPHGNIILPWPGDSTKYVLFHHSANIAIQGAGELFYSVIDMTLDNGKGAVILKNQIAFQDTLSTGIGACKHANGRDWWVVMFKDNSNIIYKLLLTPDGIDTVTTQSFAGTVTYLGSASQPEFSPDGSKFAYLTGYNIGGGWAFTMFISYFEFDRCTGMFSNFQSINITDADSAIGYPVMFSANSKYLYAATAVHVYQINTDSTVLVVDTIATYDGFTYPPGTYTNFYLMYRAKDEKIYIIGGGGSPYVHYINYPDSGGLACDVQQHALQLPCYNQGVPNHPNYFLGADTASVCDTLTIVESSIVQSLTVQISPNPSTTIITINAQQVKGKEAMLYIYSTMGEEIGRRAVANNGGYVTQDVYVGGLSNGIYIVKLQTERNVYSAKFVKQ